MDVLFTVRFYLLFAAILSDLLVFIALALILKKAKKIG
jgi:hypothetical protein